MLLGLDDGDVLGLCDGNALGLALGPDDGETLGFAVGPALGNLDGTALGRDVVGAAVICRISHDTSCANEPPDIATTYVPPSEILKVSVFDAGFLIPSAGPVNASPSSVWPMVSSAPFHPSPNESHISSS